MKNKEELENAIAYALDLMGESCDLECFKEKLDQYFEEEKNDELRT